MRRKSVPLRGLDEHLAALDKNKTKPTVREQRAAAFREQHKNAIEACTEYNRTVLSRRERAALRMREEAA